MTDQTPRTDALESRSQKLEAKLEKIEALMYEDRARAMKREAEISKQAAEQKVQIEHMEASRNKLHGTIGRWVERIVFGFIAAAGWFWDKLGGQ